MFARRSVATLLFTVLLVVGMGGDSVEAQNVRVEVGGGWALPSTTVRMVGVTEGGKPTAAAIEVGSGPNMYASIGLVWTLSDNLSLEGRLRPQQSRIRIDASDFRNRRCGGQCRFVNDPDGRLWGVSVEGQLTLTSVGQINPYFLVGLGVVRTTIDRVHAETPTNTTLRFSEVEVTDAGGDVGFGATTRIVGDLRLTAETRVTGSLPGAKENAVTAFPFTLGLSYEF